MTVPSMPMASEVARSMPAPAPVVPRQMFPPPTITASSRSSSSRASAISPANRSTTTASMVSSDDDEARASPDILSTMRLVSPTCGRLPHVRGRVERSGDGRPQEPTTTWANRTMRAEPTSAVMVCFSSRT